MVDVTNLDVRNTYTPFSLGSGSLVYMEDGASGSYAFTMEEVRAWLDTQTYLGLELQRYSETVATGSASLDRADGGIQTFTMTANITLSVAINAGESLTFHLSGGDTYTVTWPTMTWVGGSAPTLTAADVIQLWKVGTTLFGAYVGSVA